MSGFTSEHFRDISRARNVKKPQHPARVWTVEERTELRIQVELFEPKCNADWGKVAKRMGYGRSGIVEPPFNPNLSHPSLL